MNEEQKKINSYINDLIENGFQKFNMEPINKYYSTDKNGTFADADGPFHNGLEEYKKWLETVFKNANDQKFKTYTESIKNIAPDIYISISYIHVTLNMPGQDEQKMICRLSIVWRKENDKYKIIHEHFSPYSNIFAPSIGYGNSYEDIKSKF